MKKSPQRRLAAILSADVVGYSRLMGEDEAGVLERFGQCVERVVSPRVSGRGGRIVKHMGDGLLMEFPSAIEAVACALEVQKAMAEHEEPVDPDSRIVFRIGINLGDIVIDGEDIFGDGVNVAARLQEIAEPGGICLSVAVRQQISGKIDHPLRDLGHRKLKNIAEPVRVYQTETGTTQSGQESSGWPFLVPTKREPVASGGCLCGSIRYQVWAQPVLVGFCHCRHCQLALGAPLNAAAIFEKQNVTFFGETPELYQSSKLSQRAFCRNCGTSLFTDVGDMQYYSIRVGTFDNPADFPPACHYGVEGQIPWVDIHDDLPRIRTEDDPMLSALWVEIGQPKSGPTPPASADRQRGRK